MSKQINEVMELVELFGDECEACGHGAGMDTYQAIRAKLSDVIPQWQPIESAPKDVCTEFDGWNGERVTNVSWGWPDYHPKEKRCWIRSVYETGYGWISEEVHGLTHWMPLPAPPSQEGAT